MTIQYRSALDSDASGLIQLIAKCYGEYEGCILDVDQEEPQLNYIASYFKEKNGQFWVAETQKRIVGSVGYTYLDGIFELKHLYVDSETRRQGIASRLCDLVEAAAIERKAEAIILWTDTRFHQAHSLYELRGYTGGTRSRTLQDLSNTIEYYYEKSLRVG
ncbi:GNAT family N-acetyltransferase [Sneathiella glossodoripedis]|uniref:GNAT family N-acetyltransferase n=1 Tax=Sneathiella glossodoripedis TaxID=418853 RepID=UPI00131F4454|nr:GNAT family N-acetyltransferase [Sneathiella glossodoripedis]